MRIGAPGPADPGARPPSNAPQGAARVAPDFAAMLQRQLDSPRDHIADVREAIATIRAGRTFDRTTPPQADVALAPYARAAAGSRSDLFGWRSLTRSVGDEIVGPGYGAIFEQQIQQESGYDPEVAFGLRTSSAGAEGIAQLMPQYYPGVDRTNPQASLVAGARTMRHYLAAHDGDVRKALASYNAGLGRVRALVEAHGDDWERALPEETKRYLAAIVGDTAPQLPVFAGAEPAVFGGRGPGGVLTTPLGRILGERGGDTVLDMLAAAGSPVLAPADGRVISIGGLGDVQSVVLDHGNGWQTLLEGLNDLLVTVGQDVRRSDPLGSLAGEEAGQGRLRFGVGLDGRPLDPARYLLRS